MKNLDPFAGYRLASGHPIFHLSLFASSWIAEVYAEGQRSIPIAETSFWILRWAHFLLFSLALCSIFANKDSEIPIQEKNEKASQEDVEIELMRVRHRDSVWKLFGRVCDTISVFCYQGAIFFVQMSVYNEQLSCDSNGCALDPPKSALMAWLYIEMYCFYIYMFAAILYIAYHQIVEGVCFKKEREQSDMNKTINDFIEYAHTNLIWFAFNTVLILMPFICIFVLNKNATSLDIEGATMSYTSLLTIVCLANMLQFVLRPRIYIFEKKQRLYAIPEQSNKIMPSSTIMPGLSSGSSLGGALGALKKAASEQKAVSKQDSESEDMGKMEQGLIRSDEDGEHHYVWMTQRFNEERMWVWVVNLIAYIAVITTYFCVDGHELIYSIYLPLDVMLNICKAIYFFSFYWLNKREKTKEKELQKALQEGIQGALAAGIANAMKFGASSQQPEQQQTQIVDPAIEQLKLKYEEEIISQKKKQKLLENIEEKDKELDLDDDTYTMAFRALNYESAHEMDLSNDEVQDAFQAAVFVFFVQSVLIGILAIIVFTSSEGFQILLPEDITVLGARFVCSILMHLQVEGDMRQGLQMMKYVTNHPNNFSNPFYAFFVAFMQSMGGLAAEVFCIIFLCSLDDPINIIIRFVAFASIGKVDNFYAAALSPDHKLKKETEPMVIDNKRRSIDGQEKRKCANYAARFVYKTIRIMYSSFIFYFLPYLALFIPQIADVKPDTIAA